MQEGGAGGSEQSLHITGTTVVATNRRPGAAGGVMFAGKRPDDASKYAGIVFKARAAKAGQVRFNIGDINTHLQKARFGKNLLRNHFGKTLSLTTEWKEYRILFTDTRQADGRASRGRRAMMPSKSKPGIQRSAAGQMYDISVL